MIQAAPKEPEGEPSGRDIGGGRYHGRKAEGGGERGEWAEAWEGEGRRACVLVRGSKRALEAASTSVHETTCPTEGTCELAREPRYRFEATSVLANETKCPTGGTCGFVREPRCRFEAAIAFVKPPFLAPWRFPSRQNSARNPLVISSTTASCGDLPS